MHPASLPAYCILSRFSNLHLVEHSVFLPLSWYAAHVEWLPVDWLPVEWLPVDWLPVDWLPVDWLPVPAFHTLLSLARLSVLCTVRRLQVNLIISIATFAHACVCVMLFLYDVCRVGYASCQTDCYFAIDVSSNVSRPISVVSYRQFRPAPCLTWPLCTVPPHMCLLTRCPFCANRWARCPEQLVLMSWPCSFFTEQFFFTLYS